jgi:hypothetical protein
MSTLNVSFTGGPSIRFVVYNFLRRCPLLTLFGQFVAAEDVSNAGEGRRRRHRENGIGELIPYFDVTAFDP